MLFQFRIEYYFFRFKPFDLLGSCCSLFAACNFAWAMHHTCKGGKHRVIILSKKRIKLMVMATGTAHGKAKKSLAGSTDHFIHLIRANLRRCHRILISYIIVWPRNQKSRSYIQFRFALTNHIACKMLPDENIKGLIVVDRLNDIITEGPEIGNDFIALITPAFTKSNHIKPMPTPMFTIPRRGKQPIHQIVNCLL